MKGEPTRRPMGPANVEPWTEVQQLAYEKESLGLYFSGHPIDRVAAELKGFGAKTTAELAEMGAAGATGAIGAMGAMGATGAVGAAGCSPNAEPR